MFDSGTNILQSGWHLKHPTGLKFTRYDAWAHNKLLKFNDMDSLLMFTAYSVFL